MSQLNLGKQLKKAFVVTAVFLTGCCPLFNAWCPKCYRGYVGPATEFKVNATLKTPKGLRVDPSGLNVDLAALDRRVDKLEICLQDVMKKYLKLTEKQRTDWGCWPREYTPAPIKRECLTVKIVPPVQGCSKDWQFIDMLAPAQACKEKGLMPTANCPCRFRTVLQGDYIIVTPPALYLWEIVRVVTGCGKAWDSPFAACMGKGYGYE